MRSRSIFITLASLLFSLNTFAQRRVINMAEHDQKAYYFGITFGTNFSTYKIGYTKSFVENDTFRSITPMFRPGFNLGLMGNLRLNRRFDLRFVPSLAFAEKRMVIDASDGKGGDSTIDRSIESIYMHLPLQLKFKSDRIQNFRFYGMVGAKLDIDLAANARSRRADEFIKVKPIDMGYE
ncbi:MAG: PorT family protein, partial [Sphingobacteriales bacterium]